MAVYGVFCVSTAFCYLLFTNPKDEEDRFDLVLTMPILAGLAPLLFLVLVLQQPWNDKEWKSRMANNDSNDRNIESPKSDDAE